MSVISVATPAALKMTEDLVPIAVKTPALVAKIVKSPALSERSLPVIRREVS